MKQSKLRKIKSGSMAMSLTSSAVEEASFFKSLAAFTASSACSFPASVGLRACVTVTSWRKFPCKYVQVLLVTKIYNDKRY